MSADNKLKNIYMVQVSYTYGEDDSAVYLPYAAGLLMAYALTNDKNRENYQIGGFVFTREDIDSAIDKFEDPYLVGFSNYVWNTQYNKAFSARLKERYPSCIVVFGGHNVPPNESLLNDYSQIDFLIHGEGEEAFSQLLESLCTGGDFSDIPNISYRSPDSFALSTKTQRVILPLEDHPSPYLSGVFDKLMADNPHYEYCAILETSRDCPFLCAFCDWGQLRAKTRRFSKKQVLDEINWMSENKIVYVWGADPNFGMFDDDIDYAKAIAKAKSKRGYPEVLSVNYSKTRSDNVYEINLLLTRHKLSRGIPLSFQSLNSTVLKNINRENLTLEAFSGLISKYYDAGIPVYSELILGLPGETYDSFCKGIGLLLESGQHKTINVYPFELLCNSSLGSRENVERFAIETVSIPFARLHCSPETQGITEHSEIVVSTYSMNRDMWKRASQFANIIQAFHNFGLLRCFAIYLFYENNLAYETFYKAFQAFMAENPKSISGQLYAKINALYDGALSGETGLHYLDPIFGNIVWSFSEAMYLDCVFHFEEFYSEIEIFLSHLGISEEIFSDLFAYQKALIKKPFEDNRKLSLSHDLYSYFDSIYLRDKKPLERKKNITILTDGNVLTNWVDYARENVWWGRNQNRNIISDIDVSYN